MYNIIGLACVSPPLGRISLGPPRIGVKPIGARDYFLAFYYANLTLFIMFAKIYLYKGDL